MMTKLEEFVRDVKAFLIIDGDQYVPLLTTTEQQAEFWLRAFVKKVRERTALTGWDSDFREAFNEVVKELGLEKK